MVSFPQASPLTPCAPLYPPPYAPHALPLNKEQIKKGEHASLVLLFLNKSKVVPLQTMKVYVGVEIYLHLVVTLILGLGEWVR